MRFPRARITPVLVPLGAGAIIGVLGALAGKFDSPILHAVSLVFAAGWSWALLGFLVGCFCPSKAGAALLSSSALAVGVTVYYMLKALNPEPPIGVNVVLESGIESAWPRIAAWGVMAFVLGAPMGFFGNLARTSGPLGLPFRLLVPLIAYFETSWRLDVEAAAAGPGAESTWSATRVLAVLAALALAGHAVWEWRTRRKGPEVRAHSG
ncbi:hypothetical protein LUX01_10165 [Streptomyces sudanensis]|uniref:hypothetical protein n=1 Tax=Streptomyces sudanensis TaxID=436397 RepID=UPI0020CB889E|nr:hypothetical protein [Streptomyces sudanensis]MCP9987010.1 hypothetical protein [Streptomyces sudanensis]